MSESQKAVDPCEAAPGAASAPLKESGVSRQQLHKGRLLNVVCDQVILPDGKPAQREFVVHPGAVMVVAMSDDGRVVMERQFRYPMGRVMIEFPAGKLDPGEASHACAVRELLEETGYQAREWAYAGVIHPLIAYSTEHIDIWFARGLRAGACMLDQGEFLEVFLAKPEDLLQWCREGLVTDGKTLVAALWLQQVLSGQWLLAWQPVDSPCLPVPPGPFCPSLDQGDVG